MVQGIPVAVPDASCTAPSAKGIFRKPMAPRCMARAWRPTSWCGRWARWRRAWASAPSRGCSRSTRTPCCNGWSKWRTTPQPLPTIFCTTCASRRCNSMSSLALLSAVKTGEVSEGEAITRLSRSPHWVWAAIDPVTKLLLTLDVGERTLAMAQGVVHQVVQVLAPGCVPLFLTDGFKEYATALLTHYGQWVHLPR